MHILLIHQAFAALNEPGGTRHHELARYLVEHGHRVTVIASPVSYLTGSAGAPAQDPASPPDGVTIRRVYTYPAFHRSFVHRMFSFFSFMASSFLAGMRVPGVDLVWGTSPPIFQGLTAWMVARLRGVPFLFEVRDLWPAFAVQVGVLRQPQLIRLSEWLERFLYGHADQVIVNSPGFVDYVGARGARQVALLPNSADPRMFDPQADGIAFRRRFDIAPDKFVVLYAGAHGMSNDLEVVLEAARRLRDCPEIEFVLLGDGKDKPNLQRRAQELALTNLRFLPPVPKADMPQALAAANACLAILKPVPLYNTVFPNKVFDYMAAARPVVLVIDGVIRQVIERAHAGVYSPPGDPAALAETIRALAASPVQARQMGLDGRAYMENNYDRAKIARQLASLLESMLASRASR